MQYECRCNASCVYGCVCLLAEISHTEAVARVRHTFFMYFQSFCHTSFQCQCVISHALVNARRIHFGEPEKMCNRIEFEFCYVEIMYGYLK